jgi:hypothetical protein
MKFEWDESKSEACFQDRGFDFAYAARAFFDPGRIVQADTRHSYGEDRFQLMGAIELRLFVVVYTLAARVHTHHFCSQSQSTRCPTL